MTAPPMLIYRVGNFFYRNRMPRIALFFSWCNRFLFATWIPSSCTIGKNFKAGYWGLGIVVHSCTIIGDDCTVGQNVTIGRDLTDKKVPIIGNRVYIGAGSAVFGEITIGDNVIIGANSVVFKSVEANTIVAGNPARFIRKLEDKNTPIDSE